jgi:hypothetical protein
MNDNVRERSSWRLVANVLQNFDPLGGLGMYRAAKHHEPLSVEEEFAPTQRTSITNELAVG